MNISPKSTDPRFADQSGPIDPADHIGLVWRASKNASRRYGGIAEDYFGIFAHTVVRAAKKFDPSRGFRFSTYAMRAIGNDMSQIPTIVKYGRKSKVKDRPRETPCLSAELGDGATFDPPTVDDLDHLNRLLEAEWIDEDSVAALRLMARGVTKRVAAEVSGKTENWAKCSLPQFCRDIAERSKRLAEPPDEREGQDAGGRAKREAERERYRGRPLEGGGRRGFCGSCGLPLVCRTLEEAWSDKTLCGECGG